jgi:hypothetical protein
MAKSETTDTPADAARRVAPRGGGPEASSGSPRERPGKPIRARALLAALILVPATVVYSVWGTWQTAGVGPIGPLFGPAVAALFLLSLGNRSLARWRPRWAFSSGELVLVYVLMVTAGMANGVYTWFGPLASVIVHPIWGASPSNGWAEMVWPNLPTWLTVPNVPVLEGFFLGNSTPYQREVLRAWATPTFWWAAWVTGLLWVCLCLNVIVRRRWSQEERLAFPMTELPLRITQPDGGLFKSRLWWLGLGISLGIGFWNLLGRFYPALPAVPLSVDISNRIAVGPLSALRCGLVSWGFWGIGLSYLMPLDMMFSLIVFNLLWRSEYVICRMLGWNMSAWSGFPYGDEQSVGAYLAVLVTVLWVDRRYLAQVARRAVGLPSSADDREEPFSYRFAILGAIAGIAFLTWFFGRAGVATAVALSFLALYFAIMMTFSRIRAQIGPPDNEIYGSMPQFFLTQFPGTRSLGPRALAIIALNSSLLREQTDNPNPVQLEALRMSERRGISSRLLAWLMIAAIPVIVFVYFWAHLQMGYHRGLEVGSNIYLVEMPSGVAGELDAWLRNPGDANWSGTRAIGLGALITMVLMAIKLRFPSWPLHPVAFPLAWSWPIDAMLPAIAATWLVKLVLLRYGGLRAYRTALPLFLGFIVGDALTGLAWQIVRPLTAG